MSTVLKYPGAKWGIADWIIGFFPAHHSYLEPFFCSGGVLFNKKRSNIQKINYIVGEVINLFEFIKSDPERLAHDVFFTPYARAVYDEALSKEITLDSFKRAVRLLTRCNMGRGFRTTGERVGWKNDVVGRERAYAAKAWANLPDIIVETAARLREVQIECAPAVEVIFADAHEVGRFACVTPVEADRILREFYGLPAAGEAVQVPTQGSGKDNVLRLEDFFS